MPDLRLTPKDEAWLRAINEALQCDPVPMISPETYMRAVEAADHVTGENFRLRKNRRRLWKRYCLLRESRRLWRFWAIGYGIAASVLAFELGRRL